MTKSTPPKNTKTITKRVRIDYDQIEAGWRAGILSPRQLAKIYTQETGGKVSHAAIIKHFNKLGIPRDLSAKIRAKADAKVTEAMVTEKVTSETKRRDREIIDEASDIITTVRLSQRKDISRSRRIAMALFDELELQTGADNVAMLEEMAELLRSEDDKGLDRLNDLYRKIISLPERAKTMKSLADSLRVTVELERQAFGVDDKDNAPVDVLKTLLTDISERSNSAFRPIADDPEHDDD